MSHPLIRFEVFNNRNQPVELHYGQRVVVLPPQGQTEVDEGALAAPQIQALRDQGFIAIFERKIEPPGPAEKGAANEFSGASPDVPAEKPPAAPARKGQKLRGR